MQVEVTETCNAVFMHQTLQLQQGQVVQGELARHLLSGGAPVRLLEGDQDATPATPATLEDAKSVTDVLAWVGTDHDRAAQARDAELAKGDKARSTLLAKLDQVLEADPADEGEDDEDDGDDTGEDE